MASAASSDHVTNVLCCLTVPGYYIRDVSSLSVFRSNPSRRVVEKDNLVEAVMPGEREGHMATLLCRLWKDEEGQDIAEYAVMLAVILVIVVATVRLVGSNSNNVFSSVSSTMQ
jgi:pilus assembly protein Flp/PilA